MDNTKLRSSAAEPSEHERAHHVATKASREVEPWPTSPAPATRSRAHHVVVELPVGVELEDVVDVTLYELVELDVDGTLVEAFDVFAVVRQAA